MDDFLHRSYENVYNHNERHTTEEIKQFFFKKCINSNGMTTVNNEFERVQFHFSSGEEKTNFLKQAFFQPIYYEIILQDRRIEETCGRLLCCVIGERNEYAIYKCSQNYQYYMTSYNGKLHIFSCDCYNNIGSGGGSGQ